MNLVSKFVIFAVSYAGIVRLAIAVCRHWAEQDKKQNGGFNV